MNTNGAVETFEIERKYEVGDEALWPDAADFERVGLRLAEASPHELHASYLDTADGGLAALRLALRHRTGGKDEGWHLKAKGEGGARELLWPQAETVPDGVKREIEQHLGEGAGDQLTVIATLDTQRVTALLLDATGEAVIELADDRVDAVNETTGHRQKWREWEAELMPGASAEVLDLIEPLLAARGAVRVHGLSKIQRTMQATEAI